MGIIIPRPAMRGAEFRRVKARLDRHQEIMTGLEAQGVPRIEASAQAHQALRTEEKAQAETRKSRRRTA